MNIIENNIKLCIAVNVLGVGLVLFGMMNIIWALVFVLVVHIFFNTFYVIILLF